MDLKAAPSCNRRVPTQGDLLAGDQFAQAALVWITLSISGHRVYHHVHYCRGRAGHCVEVCLSGEPMGWNKWPGSEATLGRAGRLIWEDSCNYESPEEQWLRGRSDVWTRYRQTGRYAAAGPPPPLSSLPSPRLPSPLTHLPALCDRVRQVVMSIFSISWHQFSTCAQREDAVAASSRRKRWKVCYGGSGELRLSPTNPNHTLQSSCCKYLGSTFCCRLSHSPSPSPKFSKLQKHS